LGQAIVVPNACTLTKVALNSTGTGASGYLALYSDVGGSPSALVAATQLFALTSGANEVSIGAPVPLAPGTYWIAGDYTATAPVARTSTGAITTKYISRSASLAPPDPWSPAPTTYTTGAFGYYIVVTE
jgi:hypothetical protein